MSDLVVAKLALTNAGADAVWDHPGVPLLADDRDQFLKRVRGRLGWAIDDSGRARIIV